VPVGGGGLIAGIAAYVKRLRPEIKVIGVEPVDADAMTRRCRRPARERCARRPLRRRRGGEAGRRGDLPHRAQVRSTR
jgi:cysteine synthase